MKRIKVFFLAGIFVLFVVLAHGCTQPASNGGEGSRYFPDDQGNTWEYINSDGTSTITTVDGVRILPGDIIVQLFKTSDYDSGGTETGTSEAYYRVTDSAVYDHGTPTYPLDPGALWLEFPLTVGKSWTVIDGPLYDYIANVMASEDLTVPAGTFSCYKVKYTWRDNGTELSSRTYWYGDGAGIVKTIIGSPEIISVLLEKDF